MTECVPQMIQIIKSPTFNDGCGLNEMWHYQSTFKFKSFSVSLTLDKSIVNSKISYYTANRETTMFYCMNKTLDSKIHGANMGPTWVLSAPDGPMLTPWTLLSGTFRVGFQCVYPRISSERPSLLAICLQHAWVPHSVASCVCHGSFHTQSHLAERWATRNEVVSGRCVLWYLRCGKGEITN